MLHSPTKDTLNGCDAGTKRDHFHLPKLPTFQVCIDFSLCSCLIQTCFQMEGISTPSQAAAGMLQHKGLDILCPKTAVKRGCIKLCSVNGQEQSVTIHSFIHLPILTTLLEGNQSQRDTI